MSNIIYRLKRLRGEMKSKIGQFWVIWSSLEELFMLWTDRQKGNRMVEVLRIRVTAPETNSIAGTPKKGTGVHMAEVSLFLLLSEGEGGFIILVCSQAH